MNKWNKPIFIFVHALTNRAHKNNKLHINVDLLILSLPFTLHRSGSVCSKKAFTVALLYLYLLALDMMTACLLFYHALISNFFLFLLLLTTKKWVQSNRIALPPAAFLQRVTIMSPHTWICREVVGDHKIGLLRIENVLSVNSLIGEMYQ